MKKWIQYGASVRAAQYLILGAKARALTLGRYAPTFEDVLLLGAIVVIRTVLNYFLSKELERERRQVTHESDAVRS